MEDRLVVNRVLAGDTEAFSFLVEKYKRLVLSIAFQVTGNREDAEDLAQEVFVRAFLKLKTHHKASSFANWIYRITLNAALSKKRTAGFKFTEIDQGKYNLPTSEISESLQWFEKEERAAILWQAVDNLPPDERLLISLKYYNGCSISDISEITGLGVSNIKIKLFRIRKKLHGILYPLIVDE